jgi:hypothetical protein
MNLLNYVSASAGPAILGAENGSAKSYARCRCLLLVVTLVEIVMSICLGDFTLVHVGFLSYLGEETGVGFRCATCLRRL